MIKEKFAIVREKQKEIKKLQKEILDTSVKIFTDLTKIIFEKYPKVKSFGWNQYTPYFNDGDTCIFSVNTDWIYINGDPADEADWIGKTKITNYGNWNQKLKKYEGRTEVSNLNYDEDLSKATDEIREFLNNFDEDFFMSQFGDHAEVKITSEGISIDELDHE
jgi:hypothetical protein